MPNSETVVSYTHRLERLLKNKYHATGEGLQQLTESCVTRIPHGALEKLRHIAEINQKLSDDDSYELEDEAAFFRICVECEKELTPRSGRFVWGMAILLMVAITAAALLFYTIHWDVLSQHIK